jgi:hypothetical protein
LVTDQPRRAIDRMRVAALNLEVQLAAGHKEAAGFVKAIEALEVEETTIHDVERAGLGQQLVEDVDLVHLAITDVNEDGDVAAQIEQRVQLDLPCTALALASVLRATAERCCISCANTSLPRFIDGPHEVMLRRVAEPAFRVQIETKRICRLSVSHQQFQNAGTLLMR